jgi:hypothetical protein
VRWHSELVGLLLCTRVDSSQQIRSERRAVPTPSGPDECAASSSLFPRLCPLCVARVLCLWLLFLPAASQRNERAEERRLLDAENSGRN